MGKFMKIEIKDYSQFVTNLQTIAKESERIKDDEDFEWHRKLAKECLEILGEDE